MPATSIYCRDDGRFENLKEEGLVVIGGHLLRKDVRALIGGHLMRQNVPLILSKSNEAMAPTY